MELSDDDAEIILAQEQSVVQKTGFMKETQGTLILTNKRLIFVAANQELDVPIMAIGVSAGRTGRLRFADVDELDQIPKSPLNLSIPLDEIELEKGDEGFIENPRLKVKWIESGVEKKAEFIADITDSSRRMDLKDWAVVMDSLKRNDGTIKIDYPKTPSPSKDTLEGKVYYILGDMQDKGLFEIEEQTEEYFKVNLEPDDVEAACNKLVSLRVVDKMDYGSGDSFYRKHSPLGKADLSS